MGIHSTPYRMGEGQAPVDCKVYGQPRVFALRDVFWPAMAVMAVACVLVVAGLAVMP